MNLDIESQVVDISNEQNIINFVSDLQNKIGELNFNLPDGTKAIGYANFIVKQKTNY